MDYFSVLTVNAIRISQKRTGEFDETICFFFDFIYIDLAPLAPKLAAALFTPEAEEIPYQINNSDRIVIGTVSEIECM
jgi:hypothetical protein